MQVSQLKEYIKNRERELAIEVDEVGSGAKTRTKAHSFKLPLTYTIQLLHRLQSLNELLDREAGTVGKYP